MQSFIIEGGHTLSGTIVPQGAKNEALQVICASLLTEEDVRISNTPDILDVNNLIQLLRDIGVEVNKAGDGEYVFNSRNISPETLGSDAFVRKCAALRGSVMMMGPLLARFGKAVVAEPGGDKIGRRRLDTHFLGFRKLGARMEFNGDENAFEIKAMPNGGKRQNSLRGTYMLLDEASVTGSNLLTIDGVERLHGTSHRILPDMIEVGSFIGMAAMIGDGIRIKDVSAQNLGIIPEAFRRLGVSIVTSGDDLVIPRQAHYVVDSFIDGSIMTLADAPWPGLTPDLISVLLVVATQARGSVLIHQKMFESRLFFVDKLIDMGAQIILCDPHRAVVVGHDHRKQLRAGRMTSPDIRAGIALLIAALTARGTSRIDNIGQIDRGYENIEARLNALGARITRVDN